jgi:integrase
MYQDMEPFLKRQKEIRDSLFPWQDAVFFWMPESVTKGQDGGVRVSPGSPLGGDGQHFKTTKAWKEAAAAIGKPNLLMHDMRRSAVRNMIELAGMSAKQAMLYSGHRTMSMIERYHILGKGEIESARGKLQTMARENTTRPEPAPAEEPMVATMPSNVISFSSLKRKVAG